MAGVSFLEFLKGTKLILSQGPEVLGEGLIGLKDLKKRLPPHGQSTWNSPQRVG